MADMYDTPCFPSLSAAEPDDDVALFLHQTALRSSSSPSPSYSLLAQTGKQVNLFSPSRLLTHDQQPHLSSVVPTSDDRVADRISTADSSSVLNVSADAVLSSPCGFFPATVANLSSSSVGTLDNDADDCDCESEEGFEALAADEPAKPVQYRHSSKRSRAAEVHNLSEKRRRSRINEKMKALQNLIPNSNKTDKASMLDEAIEYLKQLQLQVQMLTMRNGLSLYPMCLLGVPQPSQISQMRMGFFEGNGCLDMNLKDTLPVNKETSTSRLFNLSSQSPCRNQPSFANLSNRVSSETPVGLQSSIQDHLRPFQPHPSSQGICSEDLLQHQHLHAKRSDAYPLDFQMGAKSTMPIPFDTQPSNLKDNALESCIAGRGLAKGLLTNLECDSVLSPQLNCPDIGRSGSNCETGRLNF